MRQNISLLIVTCVLSALVSCAKNETMSTPSNSTNATAASSASSTVPKVPLAEIVHANADKISLKPGATVEAQVRLSIADGYHINANPPTFNYLKPTEIAVTPEAGITVGKPTYPAPITKKFAFEQQPLAVYEHQATIQLPLSAEHDAKGGAHTLHARIRVQACDEEKCYPPTSVETSIPVQIE